MSVAPRLPQPEQLSEPGGFRGWISHPVFPLIAGTLGCLPLLVVHFQQLWARPHYQFFPLILGATAILYHLRRSEPLPRARSPRPFIAGVALVCGLLLATIAVLRISPLLAWIAWLVICLSSLFRSQRDYWSAWGLLCMLVRLPQGKDIWLIQTLQRLTTGVASSVLDQMRIDHIQEGNVLAFPAHKMFVEEACSGIVSLFMIIATAAILGALLRRTLLHTVILMGAGAFWAAAANIFRVVVLAYSKEILGKDLSEGWPHDALGLVIFVMTLVMLLSSDALLRFSLGPIEIDETGSPEPIHENWIVTLWNWAFWPALERPEANIIQAAANQPDITISSPARGITALVTITTLGFVALGGIQAWGGIGPFSRSLTISARIQQLTQDSLPLELAGWKRTDYRKIERRPTSEFGEKSQQWTYTRNNMTAIVSIDYPFPEWHSLDSCYRGTGWRTIPRAAFANSGTAKQYQLQNDQQTGHLIYDMFDQQGQQYVPPLDRGLHPRWGRLMSGDATPWTLPSYFQVQLLSSQSSLQPYTSKQSAELQLLFVAARSHLLRVMTDAPPRIEPPVQGEAP